MARFYIYELCDPVAGDVFYVGKGSGNRLYNHEDEARRGVHSRKCNRIRDIWAAGGVVHRSIVARFDDENEALQAEFERIAAIGLENLTNVLPGGVMGIQAYLARKVEHDLRVKARAEQKRRDAFVQLAPTFAQVIHAKRRGGGFGAYVGERWLEFSEAYESLFQEMVSVIGFDIAQVAMRVHGVELVRASNGSSSR